MLGIIFINTYGITSVVYQGISKMATGTGVDAVELCLIKTLTNLAIASVLVSNAGLNPIKAVPQDLRMTVFLRSIASLVANTC